MFNKKSAPAIKGKYTKIGWVGSVQIDDDGSLIINGSCAVGSVDINFDEALEHDLLSHAIPKMIERKDALAKILKGLREFPHV